MPEVPADKQFPSQSSPAEFGDGQAGFGGRVAAPPADGRLGWLALGLSTVSTVVYLATSHALSTYLDFLTSSVRKVLGVFS